MADKKQVGTVTALTLFPIKSCGGISLDEGYCGFQGLRTADESARDRCFMVITEDGRMVSQRNQPKMALIRLGLHGDQIHLDAPGMSTIQLPMTPKQDEQAKVYDCRVWGEDIKGLDCGDEFAKWFRDYLKSEFRLVCSTTDMNKRILKENAEWGKVTEQLRHQDQVAFHDNFPFMLIGSASLVDLNNKLTEKVTMKTFRPSIQVETEVPFEEDEWRTVKIGSATFKNIIPCDRCLLTTVDPESGVKSQVQEPIKTLKTYRIKPDVSKHAPCFGTNLTIEEPGIVRVGDPVYLV